MKTLPSRIQAAARVDGEVVFVDGDSADVTTWSELHRDARSVAADLVARGVTAGDHVAILGPTSRSLVTAIQATWLCGATLVMLPLPMRMGSLAQFVEQTRNRMRAADVAWVAMDGGLSQFVTFDDSDPPIIDLATVGAGFDGAELPVAEVTADELAVLQFTSGSTSEPKGVMLTHGQVCANLDAIIEASRFTADDVVVSWLPLYHDMGLIGLLCTPMTTGAGLVQCAPQDFLVRPLRWMSRISQHGGTITAGPNFSYALATRALRRADGLDVDLDLSSLRICLNGAEPVDPDGFRSFFEAGARFGLPPEAAFPAFGMAELCIGGCFPEPGRGLRTDVMDGRVLEHEHLAVPVEVGAPGARELAVLGRPVPGLEMRVVDPSTRAPRREREVGELQIRGTSVTLGYYRQPIETEELLVGGWLHTGDLAYFVDGELVMCGRIKDVIIVGGRNVYPQDIEAVVGRLDEVRTGNVIAFGVDGAHSKQHIVVVAETRTDDADGLRRAITRAVTDEIGIPPREVVLVDAGTIPKTSSGKLQRAACRTDYERKAFTESDLANTSPTKSGGA